MAGMLLSVPVFRAVDANGAPMPGALLQFYATGTTTPTPVYTSSALTTALSNPVVADSGGLFVPIYLDPTVTYRAQLLTSAGVLIRDVDPITEGIVEATTAQVNAGTVTGVFVSPAKLAAWTGVAAALGYAPANKAGDTLTNALLANTALASTSAGYLGLPLNEQDASYTTVLADAGRMIRCASASATTCTIPPLSSVAYPVGTVITFRNTAVGGTVTLTPGSGVEFFKAGATTPASSVALAPGALCSAILETTNVWIITGVGIT